MDDKLKKRRELLDEKKAKMVDDREKEKTIKGRYKSKEKNKKLTTDERLARIEELLEL